MIVLGDHDDFHYRMIFILEFHSREEAKGKEEAVLIYRQYWAWLDLSAVRAA